MFFDTNDNAAVQGGSGQGRGGEGYWLEYMCSWKYDDDLPIVMDGL